MGTTRLRGGVSGGLLAGASVGMLEAILGWLHAHSAGELPSVAWALCSYGLLGGVGGAGIGAIASLAGLDGFALSFAAIATVLIVVVGRFRIVRDVLLEKAPQGIVPHLVELAAVAATITLGVLVWSKLRGLGDSRALITRPLVGLGIVGVVGGVWAGGASFIHSQPPERLVPHMQPPIGAPDVLLIGIDTLRADHLSCYGYTKNETLNIDALARDGIRYANAFSQASWTRPSFATILTGLYPSSHRAIHKADRLPDSIDTLAELLHRGGYQTVGFADNINIAPVFSFQQGFDEYRYLAPSLFFYADDAAAQLTLYSGFRLVRERFFARYVNVYNYYQPAEVVTATVRDWLDHRGDVHQPLFLFVHYMDPHDPYFVHPFSGEGYARVANPNPSVSVADKYRHLYDGEISYLDQHLGALFDDLRRRGLYDSMLIVLTGDHGEEFREHGGWWHGTTLYDEQIHVPLIVKLPQGRGGGREASEMVMSVDITPTILTSAHVALPSSLQGHSLSFDAAATGGHDRVFAEEDFEGNVLQAVRTPEWKFIVANPGNPRGLRPEQLFDVVHDAGETLDLSSKSPQAVERWRDTLGECSLHARGLSRESEKGKEDSATTERLRALGYVQ